MTINLLRPEISKLLKMPFLTALSERCCASIKKLYALRLKKNSKINTFHNF